LKDIYDIIREWRKRRNENLALATLVRAEGSSYRRPGARMLICEDGTRVGSLSAGCLEDEVAARAGEVLQTGKAQSVSFDTRRRFGCSGKIEIYIEPADGSFFANLAKELDARRQYVSVIQFNGHKFVQAIVPPLRVILFGDAADNPPILSLGNLVGWDMVEATDPNSFSIEPDQRTAAIVKTHNYGRDFVALQKLLPLNLPYVGLIGPRKRRDQLMNALLDSGVTINTGFFAPAGLNLGAETPEEIALSIAAEIQRVFGNGTGESLRERKAAIHVASGSQTRVVGNAVA
jgi:xanthine dehydrogenase accessory factor